MSPRPSKGPSPQVSRFAWVKYLPFIAVPFAVLFCETWWRTTLLGNEYLERSFQLQDRDLRRAIENLRAEEAELVPMERIDREAPVLGLVRAKPGQVKVIRADSDEAVHHDAPD